MADTKKPTITCPQPVTLECTGNSSAQVALSAVSSDTCSATTNFGPSGLQTYPLGFTPVSFFAQDAAGNTGNCATAVTVQDTKAPTIQCPAKVTAECTGAGQATVNPGHAQAVDACGAVTIVNAATQPYSLGTTQTTFKATDPSGNQSQCNSSVVVRDTKAPTATVAAGNGNPSKYLWPITDQLVTVDLLADCQLSANDVCQGALVLSGANTTIGCVTANENQNPADANNGPDVVKVDATHVQLRLNTYQGQAGRIYRINYTVKDATGNATTGYCRVDVSPPARPPDTGGIGTTSASRPVQGRRTSSSPRFNPHKQIKKQAPQLRGVKQSPIPCARRVDSRPRPAGNCTIVPALKAGRALAVWLLPRSVPEPTTRRRR